VRDAQKWVESDKIAETIKTLPYHQKLVLSIIASFDGKEVGTNEIYAEYKRLCEGATPLSKARVSSFISELDMLGLVNSKKLYKGRQGRIRLVTSNVPREKVDGLLAEQS
jgi:cell division control protein 6